MCRIEIKPDAVLPRKTIEAIDGQNEMASHPGMAWGQTYAGWRAEIATGVVCLLLMGAAIMAWGPVLFDQTHNIGVMLILPAVAVLFGNGLTYIVFGGETLISFIASNVFGVATAPDLYLKRASDRGAIEVRECDRTHDYD